MLGRALALLLPFAAFAQQAMRPSQHHQTAPRHRRGRWSGPVPMTVCRCCGKWVSARRDRKHLCETPWQPMPRHGWRVEHGQLVERAQS